VCVCVCVCVGLVALLQAKQAKQAKHTSAAEHVTAVASTDLLRILCPAPRAMTSMLVCVFCTCGAQWQGAPGLFVLVNEPVSGCECPFGPVCGC